VFEFRLQILMNAPFRPAARLEHASTHTVATTA